MFLLTFSELPPYRVSLILIYLSFFARGSQVNKCLCCFWERFEKVFFYLKLFTKTQLIFSYKTSTIVCQCDWTLVENIQKRFCDKLSILINSSSKCFQPTTRMRLQFLKIHGNFWRQFLSIKMIAFFVKKEWNLKHPLLSRIFFGKCWNNNNF
jgi:hypothetical protein